LIRDKVGNDVDAPSPPERSSLSLSSSAMSSSLERADIYSSSESMPFDAVVNGVNGAASRLAEARSFLLGWVSSVEVEDIVASAAFRFRVVGGMVPV
jgi:hypothetical protein